MMHPQNRTFEALSFETDGPTQETISWDPAAGGGANFRTQQLKRTGNVIRITPSLGGRAFALAFLLPGLIAALGIAPWLLMKSQVLAGVFLLVWGVLFGGGGALILYSLRRITFDKPRGIFHVGKLRADGSAKLKGRLQDIHALQCLSERVTSSEGAPYRSYELNLVFKNGQRLNVMDHGAKMVVELAAEELSQFLGVPVWHARDRASV